MENWKKAAIGTTIIISIVALGLLAVRYETNVIYDYIDDGHQYSISLSGRITGFSATFTSTNADMNIKIVVDGITVYERKHVYDANFKYKLNSGQHTIYTIITNPTTFGLGSSILVTGQITLQKW